MKISRTCFPDEDSAPFLVICAGSTAWVVVLHVHCGPGAFGDAGDRTERENEASVVAVQVELTVPL